MTVGRAACRVDFLVTTPVTSPQDQKVMSVSRRMRVPFNLDPPTRYSRVGRCDSDLVFAVGV